MPWISVSVTGADRWPDPAEVARAAATALDLTATEVVVLQPGTTDGWGRGALVTVHGRTREPDREAALVTVLRRVVAEASGLTEDLVHVARTAP